MQAKFTALDSVMAREQLAELYHVTAEALGVTLFQPTIVFLPYLVGGRLLNYGLPDITLTVEG